MDIVLAMSDRFGKDYAIGDARITDYLTRIKAITNEAITPASCIERRAKAALSSKGGVGAYELFRQAMDCFEKAEAMRPAGNDDAILRWNGCATHHRPKQASSRGRWDTIFLNSQETQALILLVISICN